MRRTGAPYVFISLMFALGVPYTAFAAGMLYLEPATGEHAVGEEFTIHVRADSDGTPVNSAEAELSFNPAALEVLRIRKEGSVLSSWPSEPAFSNESGVITFSGWAGKYAVHDGATLLTIDFRTRQPMVGTVRFVNAAMLTADAQSTNVITTLQSGLYTGMIRTITPIAALPPVPIPVPEKSADIPEVDLLEVVTVVDAPLITEVPTTLMSDERLIVRGSAAPLSAVYLWLRHDGGAAQRFTTESTSEGIFTYVSPEGLAVGSYQLTAEARLGNGLQSPLSDEKIFLVADGRVAGTAAVSAAVAVYTVPLVALAALGAAFFAVYFFGRRREQNT